MLQRGTLNLMCGGPSAGKTTLTYQSILAHEKGERFFVPELSYPDGPIVVVNTDRTGAVNAEFFKRMGITRTHCIALVDEKELHQLTRPAKDDIGPLRSFRKALWDRIKPLNPGTVILDLYSDFISGNTGNHKLLMHDGRENVQWAVEMNVALLGLVYPYKQKATNSAARVQDRIAGATAIQASSSWKFNITDAAETKSCWIIDCIPPPMGGPDKTYYGLRSNDKDGVGRFFACDAPPQQSVEAIMEQNGVGKRRAYDYAAEDFDLWRRSQEKKNPN